MIANRISEIVQGLDQLGERMTSKQKQALVAAVHPLREVENEEATAAVTDPLRDACILQQVFAFLPGSHLSLQLSAGTGKLSTQAKESSNFTASA
jgi:hypothetical protein